MTPAQNSTPESIWTRLEFFADQFERLAKTSKQHALADNFRAFVQDKSTATPATADLAPILTFLEDYAISFAQIARTPEQKALVADFQYFVSEIDGLQRQEASQLMPPAPGPDPRFYPYIDPVLTELEAFGDEFERLARNPEQRQLAARFKEWIHNTSRTFFIPGARTLAETLFSNTTPEAGQQTPPEHTHQRHHKL
jgi:hypothetical protein